MTDILEKLNGRIAQATIERSHYYVASTAREAVYEIERLRQKVQLLTALVKLTGEP